MNHLTDIYLGTMHSQITYDPLRRMTGKITDNTLVFSGAVYDETAKPHAIDYAEVDAGSFSEHSLTYTSFDKVKTITQGNNTMEYTYGYDRQRIFMEEFTNGVERTKRYVGNCEFVAVTENNATTEKTLTYLTGPMGVFAVVEQQGNDESLHYILKDHLGSWTTITDAEGVVEQEQSFDAWGTRRNPETWHSSSQLPEPMFDRGFTGHEHLYAFGLINMNGRMYDPQMSSFLSVDAYVQSPDNSQSFNRYAYCLNNPLKYTDPSGWVMQGGMTPSNPFHENWGVNFAEKAYTTVEVKQMLWSMGVSTENWMMGNEMHGGGGDIKGIKGGWIKNSIGITWNPNVSSQKDLKKQGIEGTFLGQTYIDEVSLTYYSMLGYTIDMTIQNGLAGKLAPLIDNAIEELIQFEMDEAAYNNWKSSIEPYQEYTNFGLAIEYDVSKGGVNQYDIDIGFAICHFSVFNNPQAMSAKLDHIDFDKNKDSNSGFGFVNWIDGYNINFISKINQNSSNPRNIRTLIITFTNENSWFDFQSRYKAVRGY